MTRPLQSLGPLLASAVCLSLTACRAKPPSRMEARVVNWTKHHVTVGGRSDKLPIANTAENADAGRHAFGYYCVACHGRDGQNTGVPFAASMAPPIPSLASPEIQSYTDGQLKWIIDNGIFPSGMPASKRIMSEEEIWQVVVYLRHLPQAGSLGEPRAYGEDEYEQEQAQPKQ